LIFSKDDEAEDTKTPLEEKLEELAIQIGHFGMYSALTIFIILIIRLIIDNLLINGFDFQKDIGQVINYLIISVAIIVMAVP
jgi:magnesium-transporting ATPase (P-type)